MTMCPTSFFMLKWDVKKYYKNEKSLPTYIIIIITIIIIIIIMYQHCDRYLSK